MRSVRIGLLWHSDRSGNLGVGALTVGNIALVRQVAAELGVEPDFVILGFADPGRPYIDDPRVAFRPLTARTAAGVARDVRSLDAVLDIGAGDSFTDIYPVRRFAWIVGSKVAVIARGVPLVLSPQTVGPFAGGSAAKRALGRVAAWTMRRSRAVVVRDDRSLAAVTAMVPGVRAVYAIDVAFALPFVPAARSGRIGINVSGLLWRGGYTGRGEFNLGYDYRALMTGLIERLLGEGRTVELIAHVNGNGTSPDDDGSVADELAARWPGLVRIPDFVSPSDAKSYISGLDLLVAARMHACIAAFSAGVAVVPVSYSRKFEGLFGSLGYDRIVRCTGMDTAAAAGVIDTAIAEQALVRDEVSACLGQVEARLDAYRAVLRDLLTAVAR